MGLKQILCSKIEKLVEKLLSLHKEKKGLKKPYQGYINLAAWVRTITAVTLSAGW